jgi:diguanylate cyclase (GGDEF)-like protein
MNKRTTILVVDDDPALRKTLADILRLKGYESVTAATGAEAVAAAQTQPISLALIDLMLPDMPGMEVMERIKAISPLTEAIILTGNASLDSAIEATKKDAFCYLLKPYKMDDLLLNIRHGVERHQARGEIARLASFPRLSPNPVVELDAAGEVTYANPAAERLFPDLPTLRLQHPLLVGLGQMFAAMQLGVPKELVREITIGDATYEEQIFYVREGNVMRIYGKDITVRARAIRWLAQREREQTAVAELGTLALVGQELTALFDQASVRVAAILDAKCCLILERSPNGDALLLRACAGCDVGRYSEARLPAGLDALWEHTLTSGELTCLPNLADDRRFPGLQPLVAAGVASGITLTIGSRENPLGVLGVFTAEPCDFSQNETNVLQSVANLLGVAIQRKRAEEEINLLASTDSLTGIANRRAFLVILERDIERARRHGPIPSIIMYDLDHFKRVNDTFGHGVGDEVLCGSSGIVKHNTRVSDLLARWGGEEFMVLIAEGDSGVAASMAEKLRQAIAAHRFDQVGQVTASFGVTTFRQGESMNSFLQRVDDALYAAKANGRNRVETR